MWFQDVPRWLFGKEGKSVDKMGEGEDGDPGYESIMDTTGISWWNVNPIYVPLASQVVVIGVDEFRSLHTIGFDMLYYYESNFFVTSLSARY